MVCDTKMNNSDTDTARFISPPVDIFETEEGLQVMADLPGVEIDDVEIQVEEDRLIIKGRTSYAPETTGSLHREFRLVNFQRQFELDNDTAYSVSDVQAFAASRQLLKLEGILGGVSTGVHLAAALEYCRAQSEPKRVVSLVCDSGHKYLSTAYDDAWLLDRGLAPRRNYGDLRDIITHPAGEGGVVSISPEDSLLSAYTRIRMFDVSQLPVLDNGRIVGLIDESDLLLAVYDNRKYFGYPVRDFMITRLEKIDPGASISTLVPVFRGDHVAIIADESRFYGLITQVDLIDHLRKSMQANNQ